MRVPNELEPEAKKFWKRHHDSCVENGSLTEQTADTFALLCRLWGILHTTNPSTDSKAAMRFVGIMKQYVSLAKTFGIVNAKAPSSKPSKSIGEILKDALQSQENHEQDE